METSIGLIAPEGEDLAADMKRAVSEATEAMFKRYADLFSEEETRARQREVQNRRREWRKAQPANVAAVPKRAVQ